MVRKPVKIIDCHERKIMPCTSHTEYLALSYVWGKRSKSTLQSSPLKTNEELPNNIPGIISDAMDLVVSLGFQNLWVDRFCIDQDDEQESRDQIARMDEIYEGALLTIVAASREATNKGLPGISIPRSKIPCVRISDRLSLQVILHVSRSLTASKWNSRAWTYQEFCLSRRCLILVDDQVHFICGRGRTCEGARESMLSQLPYTKRRCLDPGILENVRSRLPTFSRQLSAYTRRELSYDSDMLNAFRGILSRSQLVSYWGVPVYSMDHPPELMSSDTGASGLSVFHLGFMLGLCWEAPSAWAGSKRQGFPSWSWVSNRGPIEYPAAFDGNSKDDELWVDRSTVKTSVEVFLDNPSTHAEGDASHMADISGKTLRLIPGRSPFIYIRSIVRAIPVEYWPQWQGRVIFDCGKEPEQVESPMELILLISRQYQLGLVHYYMIVTFSEDVAHRVGLAHILEDKEDLLLTVHESKIIKVG